MHPETRARSPLASDNDDVVEDVNRDAHEVIEQASMGDQEAGGGVTDDVLEIERGANALAASHYRRWSYR
jgi:hypothetical protein